MAAQLVHPSAIRVLELGLEDDPPYMVMEWVGVTTLAESVRASGPKSRQEAIELIHAVAGAIKALIDWDCPTASSVPVTCSWPARPSPSLTLPEPAVGFPGEPGTRARPSAM